MRSWSIPSIRAADDDDDEEEEEEEEEKEMNRYGVARAVSVKAARGMVMMMADKR